MNGQKKYPNICCLQVTYATGKDIYTDGEGMEKDIIHKVKPKVSRNSSFIADKIDIKSETIKWDKEGHCITIKASV